MSQTVTYIKRETSIMKPLERQFTSMLNLGNGEFSFLILEELVRSFRVAVEDLAGLQQPPMSTDEPIDDEDIRLVMERDIETVVRDIACALTGKEIEFK